MATSDVSARISELYAVPLFELAWESKQVDRIARDLWCMGQLLETQPLFSRFLASPQFTNDTHCALLLKVVTNRFSELSIRFLLTVLKHGRARFLPEIIAKFKRLSDALAGRCCVEVAMAQPLDGAQKAHLRDALSVALDATIELTTVLDPSLLGGTVIRYNGKVVDNSVKGRLNQAIKGIMRQRKG